MAITLRTIDILSVRMVRVGFGLLRQAPRVPPSRVVSIPHFRFVPGPIKAKWRLGHSNVHGGICKRVYDKRVAHMNMRLDAAQKHHGGREYCHFKVQVLR
jgi:hypothetical protein